MKVLTDGNQPEKNTLYKITDARVVRFEEKHDNYNDIVDVNFALDEQQYGIYGKEYRSPAVCKYGCKTTDVLACVVDEQNKVISTLIFDVKSNISAFSDDLFKDQAMLTAIKEVRDFVQQLHDELLHKNSFMLYYRDEGYTEREELGIVTKNFESNKFLEVSEMIVKIIQEEDLEISPLLKLKLKKSLMPYLNQVEVLKRFSSKVVEIGGKTYSLKIFLLNQLEDSNYYVSIPMTVS